MKTRTIAGQPALVFLAVIAVSLLLTACTGENGSDALVGPTETPQAVAQATAAATPAVPTPTAAPAPTVAPTPADEAPYVELIAYIAPDGNVWTVRPDGTDTRRVTVNGDNAQPAWSPDGTRLAYIHGSREVHLIRPDGSGDSIVSSRLGPECTQQWGPELTSLNAMRTRVRFTPDGKGLRLGIDWGGITNQFICHIPLDPAVPALPTVDTADEFDVNPVDGRLVATLSGQGCAVMFLIGPANEGFGDRPRIGPKMGDGCSIPEYQPVALPVYPYAPTWSPDGRQIAFYGIDFGEAGSHLYVMDAQANTFPQPIAAVSTPQDLSGKALGLSWSPDGTQIAFDNEGGVWIVNSDGSGTPARVTDGRNPAWGRVRTDAGGAGGGPGGLPPGLP